MSGTSDGLESGYVKDKKELSTLSGSDYCKENEITQRTKSGYLEIAGKKILKLF